jgi:rod shape determining protein RodA
MLQGGRHFTSSLLPVTTGIPAPARRFRHLARRDSWVRRFDWMLLGLAVVLSLYGALVVWSATRDKPNLTGGDPNYFVDRHVLDLCIGLVLAAITARLDHRWLRAWVPVLYLLAFVGLLAVLSPLGSTVNGAKSWIELGGGFSLQPAEFAKIGVAVGMAMVFAERPTRARDGEPPGVTRIAIAIAVAALPCGIIVLLPDLGSTMVIVATMIGVLVISGISGRALAALTVLAAAGVFIVVKFHLLAQHQVNRFAAFADPKLDPQGVGYNTAQARLAIGSGGLTGTGLFHGAQTNGQYVPEQQTDFIFTVVGEELGFVGGVVMIALFGLLLWRAIRIAKQAGDTFGTLAATGIVCWFAFEMFENIGMTIGIMPVAGIPLPFISYGGSSMFAEFIAIGFLENIRLRSTRPPGNGMVANPKRTWLNRPLIGA